MHLYSNKIVLDDNLLPIEQLLKIASNESQEYFNNLYQMNRNNLKQEVKLRILAMKPIERLPFISKPFKLSDVWYIILRTMNVQYIRQWKSLFFQLFFYISLAFCICKLFNENIGKNSGCFNPHTLSNETCIEYLEEDKQLKSNQNFLYLAVNMVQFIHICYATSSYLADMKLFLSEHDNRE